MCGDVLFLLLKEANTQANLRIVSDSAQACTKKITNKIFRILPSTFYSPVTNVLK
jgi:hypothetical protein